VFNVGRGEPVTVIELLEALAAAYELEPRYTIPGDFRPGDVRHLVHDATSIRELGWRPETSLADGLSAVAGWIRSQGSLDDYYSDALERLRERGVVQSAAAT
jgi:dTDP-L-rhamnose 4-epimerase